MDHRTWCAECGVSFESGMAARSAVVPALCTECDVVWCARECFGPARHRDELDAAGVCPDCRAREATRRQLEAWVAVQVPRIEAWVAFDGTRRHLAARLAE